MSVLDLPAAFSLDNLGSADIERQVVVFIKLAELGSLERQL